MAELRKRAGVYGRQSHGKQVSVEDQLREGQAVCDREGWDAVRFTDRVSASRFGTRERGGWAELIADVDAGSLDVVVLWDSSRGDRTPTTWTAFLESCRQHEVEIYVIRDRHLYRLDVPRDWKTLHDSGTDAAYESEIRSVDVKRGVAGAVLAGKAHGPAPWAFTRIYDRHDRRIFTQVPNDDAPVARAIIERIARQHPIVHLVAELNEAEVPAPGGGEWTRNGLRNVATNPAYAGLRSHNGKLYPGNWKGVVPEATWRDAQAVLADPSRKTTRPGRYRWLLSYLATSPCTGHLNGRPAREPRKRSYYRCVVDGCTTAGVVELDAYIERLVLARLARPDVRDALTPDDDAASAARAEVARVRAELDDLATQLELGPDRGGISASLAARAEPGISARLARAEQQMVTTARNGAVLALLGEGEVTEAILRPRWGLLGVASRRAVISAVISEIVVRPAVAQVPRGSSEEDRLRLVAERTAVSWRQ